MLFLTLKCVYEFVNRRDVNRHKEMINFELKNISKWSSDLFHLIYPNTCLICENELPPSNKFICSFCHNDFNYTYFERYSEPTPLDQLFWGRVSVFSTYSYLYFEKAKSTQPILHALKYGDKPEIGIEMGKLIGEQVKQLSSFQGIDALVPVPIHPKKEFTRGYNQSEKLADGIAEILNLPVLINYIERTKNSDSQTKKGRFKRWDNVENKFISKNTTNFKHIALVDDVITTGATLEVIVRILQENNPELRISIISLALTK